MVATTPSLKNFQINSWLKDFKPHTYKTEILELPQTWCLQLTADGVFVDSSSKAVRMLCYAIFIRMFRNVELHITHLLKILGSSWALKYHSNELKFTSADASQKQI